MHVTIDGFGGNPAQLGNLELVRNLLDRYPDEIGMTKISEPHVLRVLRRSSRRTGASQASCSSPKATSPSTRSREHGQVWVDIFSCKGFDDTPAIDRIVEAFDLQDTRINKLERGLEYPHDVRSIERIATT